MIRVSPTPTSGLDSATLPIPHSVSAFNPNDKGKGKSTDNMDIDDADDKEKIFKGYILQSQGSHIEVLSTYRNIAPINDAILVNIDAGGQVCNFSDTMIGVAS